GGRYQRRPGGRPGSRPAPAGRKAPARGRRRLDRLCASRRHHGGAGGVLPAPGDDRGSVATVVTVGGTHVESMTDKIRELEERNRRAFAGGGEERVAQQHQRGKLTARERLDLLFDEGTFTELDRFVHHRATDFGMAQREAPGDGVVTGFGLIDGRLVYAYAQDFTVLGGSLGGMQAKIICTI